MMERDQFIVKQNTGDPEYDERVEAFMQAVTTLAGFYPESVMQAMSIYFTKIDEITYASSILQDIVLHLDGKNLMAEMDEE